MQILHTSQTDKKKKMKHVCYIWQTPEFRKKIGKIMQEVYDDFIEILKKEPLKESKNE